MSAQRIPKIHIPRSLDLNHQGERAYAPAPVITRITIDRLFGKYSYSFPEYELDGAFGDYNRLILLYGDNGSGKTTILNLVYHLLSPATARGHRSYIAKTPFEKLAIEFGNGTGITASRSEGQLVGSFVITILRDGAVLQNFVMEADEELSIPNPRTPEEVRTNESLTRQLANLKLKPYYLADDRNFYSDALDDEDEDERWLNVSYRYALLPDQGKAFSRPIRRERQLANAMTRAKDWLRQQAFRGTSTGSANTNALYLDVLRHLASSSSRSRETSITTEGRDITQQLKSLEQRTSAYETFGLSTPLQADEYLSIVSQAAADRRELIEEVLIPYLEGIEARLDALKELYELLVTFTTAVNSFLSDKSLRFNVREGISILSSDGEELQPLALSSGERQLLLLLCSTLVARDDTRLFIIDEPEISLNVKWQRQLLEALLNCTAGTDLQFLIATHSIEMVAGHRESLARLVNQRD